jgi:hypothetical protein
MPMDTRTTVSEITNLKLYKQYVRNHREAFGEVLEKGGLFNIGIGVAMELIIEK